MPFNEADTRAKLIDPALYGRGWTEEHIKREESAGGITVVNGKPRRSGKGRTDYTLRLRVAGGTEPVAVALIEAKAQHLPPGHGMEQAKDYSRRLNVVFVFSSNGHMFVEYDGFTGLTTQPRLLAEFPTPAELRARYEAGKGFRLDDPAARPLLTPYAGGDEGRRYYQDAAIRAVLERLARCEVEGLPSRALLSLATGAGKTFIAVNLLKRIADAGQLRRALFVCDREELRRQAHLALQNVFGSDAAEVAGSNPQKNARVLVATYQTLDVDSDEDDASFLLRHYPPDYFSHIIIDECHRSAWGKWSAVLTHNPAAVQVGLTATPRELVGPDESADSLADARITADNVRYFGEPVYEYDIGQGIEDGYLAACEIRQGRVNLDATGLTIDEVLAHSPTDATTGQPYTREALEAFYTKQQFESRIVLPDRVIAMSGDLFGQFLATGGPEQKTIIFCASDRHADDVARELNNLYAEWCAAQGRERVSVYAFKCTASNNGGEMLADLRGSEHHHFVATTVDLLTTGVDVPNICNVVFFRYVRSPITFYQMVGRGTRLDLANDKLMFRVYDYTEATALFGGAFLSRLAPPPTAGADSADPSDPTSGDGPALRQIVQVAGFEVEVSESGRLILMMQDGEARPVTLDIYKAELARRLLVLAPDLAALRAAWVVSNSRQALLLELPEGGRSVELVRQLDHREEYDTFDLLAELGYGSPALTRRQRATAFRLSYASWLAGLPPATAATVLALVEQFAMGGMEGLETDRLYRLPGVQAAGGLNAIKVLNAAHPIEALTDIKRRIVAL